MKYLVCSLFILTILLQARVSSATSYSVSPLIIEHALAPRGGSTEEIVITNTTNRVLMIYPTLHEVSIGEGGELTIVRDRVLTDGSVTVSRWIEVQRGRVTIAPQETVRIPVKISLHPQAAAGVYYAVIYWPEGTNRPIAEASLVDTSVPSTLLRIEVIDTRRTQLKLEGFHIERFVLDETAKVASVSIVNTGDTTIEPQGSIILYNNRGVEVSSIPFSAPPLAPQQSTLISVPLTDETIIGRHKAFLTLVSDSNQSATVYDTTFFTAVPLAWLLSVFIGLLSVTGIGTYIYYRRIMMRKHTVSHDDIPLYVNVRHDHEIYEHDLTITK